MRRLPGRDAATGTALVLVGFALRCLYVVSVSADPSVRYPMVDAGAYHRRALEILAGDWLGDRVFFQDPLYPYFLAALYALFAPGSPGVLVAQAALDSLTVALVFLLARRLFDFRCAVLAGALAALYEVCFYYDALLLKVPLTVFLISLALLLVCRALDSDRPARWLAAGLALGAASLTRGNYLLFVPVLLGWLLLEGRGAPARRAAAAGLLAAGIAAAILPVAVRNYVVGKDLVLITAQAGQNFYIGNYRGNRTGRNRMPEFSGINPLTEEADFRAEAERRAGRALSPSELSRFWFRQGLAEIAADPGHFLRHALVKARLFFNHYEVPDNQNFYFFAEHVAPMLRLPFPTYGALLPLALCGMVFARRRPGARVLILFFLTYAASAVVFYNLSRYRMPVVPVVAVFAAHGALELARAVWRGELRRCLPALLFLLLAYPFVYRDVTRDDFSINRFNRGVRQVEQADVHRSRARELAASGDPAPAERERERADALLDRAEAEFARGLEIRPDHRTLRRALRELLIRRVDEARREGQPALALERARALDLRFRDDPDALARLGAAYADLGRDAEARSALRQALRRAPGHALAAAELARLGEGGPGGSPQ